jgi:ribosome recycling factor
MYKEIINKVKPEFEKAVQFLEKEMMKIRTGRASTSLVEDIAVDYLGSKYSLKQLASISIPESRTIVIQPWDKSYMEPIQNAIINSNIGANPIADKDVLRLTLPPMSDEYRKNLIHLISEKTEEVKRTIRHYREEAWKQIQEGTKAGTIREDDKFRAKDELQEVIDEFHKKIDEMAEKKKKEITEL